MNRRHFCGLVLSGAAMAAIDGRSLPLRAQPAASSAFFFRPGDRVVMIGDSITEQHLHSNYVEIYTLSRFPQWDLHFRNVGIGGDTSAGGNSRTQRDILSYNPTAVTITFGMNDAGYRFPYDPPRLEAYRAGLQGMLEQMKPRNVRVAVLSSSPVEKKEDGPALEGYNQTLEIFAANAKEVAEKNGATYVDQFHPHVAALQRARDASMTNRVNGGDAVHPGPPGQLLMAWGILKGLHAPALVSSLEINADQGRVVESRNCTAAGVRKTADGVRFLRADNALPFWIPPAARPILQWAPIVQDLDQYTLKVSHLPAGSYALRIDGETCATVSAADLAAGYNMALLTEGPIARQAAAVDAAVFAKNRYYHDQVYRGVVLNGGVPADQKEAMIQARMAGMPAMEQAVRDALVLRPHLFEITRA
jgi:lysophospholipase L1-like esterase